MLFCVSGVVAVNFISNMLLTLSIKRHSLVPTPAPSIETLQLLIPDAVPISIGILNSILGVSPKGYEF